MPTVDRQLAPDPFAAPPPVRTGEVTLPRRGRTLKVAFVVVAAVLATIVVALSAMRREVPTPPAVEVRSDPAGATVKLDGHVVPGVTPLTLTGGLRSGATQSVEVSLAGYETKTLEIQPLEGAREVQVVPLLPLRATLHVETEPPLGNVWIDEQLHGPAPVDVPGLPVGRDVRVRAGKRGYADAEAVVPITAQDLTPSVRLALERQR